MAQWYRAQVVVPHNSGLPKDAITNSYAFMVSGSGDRDLIAADIDTRLTGFYNAFVQYCASTHVWANAVVKVYDMLEPRPRFPYAELGLSLTPGSATPNDLPSEVAICLSFEGARESGANMRRRRGRVYLGPLQLTSSDYQFVPSAVITAITGGASTHLLNPTTPAGLSDWAVYSPYTHHGIPVGQKLTEDSEEVPDALPASFTPVARAWVDNAFDTQRRRGFTATSRTTIT